MGDDSIPGRIARSTGGTVRFSGASAAHPPKCAIRHARGRKKFRLAADTPGNSLGSAPGKSPTRGIPASATKVFRPEAAASSGPGLARLGRAAARRPWRNAPSGAHPNSAEGASATEQASEQVAQYTGERRGPGEQRRSEEGGGHRREERKVQGARHLEGARGVHAQGEDGAPPERVVAQGETPADMAPEGEHEEERDPPRAGRPAEDGESVDKGKQGPQERGVGRVEVISASASVEIAIAPMPIQYGGVRSPGATGNQTHR